MTNPSTAEPPGEERSSEGDVQVSVNDVVASSDVIGTVPVRISYGIIERFSEGLYSSPTKTFEELITNSYDADAREVWVYLPPDFTNPDAVLVVIDDGESMDLDGLVDLWRIGESKKRSSPALAAGRRKPVGKFGIGKLATYVLANELTYLVHKNDEYLAVTMDYRRVSPGAEMMDGVDLSLQVVRLTEAQAIETLTAAMAWTTKGVQAKIFAEIPRLQNWTIALLSNLKKASKEIKVGRLRWVLRSALPLNPSFKLWFDDEELHSSKADGKVSWEFTVGRDEGQLINNPKSPWGPHEAASVILPGEGKDVVVPAIKLPHAGLVRGKATMYEKPLERGRSEDLARSHGFFVRVRGRLINLYDDDFAIGPELRHGTLTRFRMEVDADDLDEQVASARESLKESPALQELKNYLLAVFNKARGSSSDADDKDIIPNIGKSGRLARPSKALTQGPFRRLLQRAVQGELSLAQSLGFDDDAIARTGELLDTGGDVIENVVLEESGEDSPLAVYDPVRRAVILNQAHPFVNNYIESKSVAEPLKLLGLSELLTKAYLLDENVPPDVILRVMLRRDHFMRELTARFPRSASLIARQLRTSTNDENALEDAVGDALELLGFSVRKLGGAGHGTDGIATARMGQRGGDRSESYAFSYDAKSTRDSVRRALSGQDTPPSASLPGRIRADTARTSVLRVHRERAAADYGLDVAPSFTLLIAPDYQGAADERGLINEVCRNDDITAIRVDDLARLVELFTLQGLNPQDLRPLFEARTPDETKSWVDQQSQKARVPRPPVAVLVETLVENSERRSPVVFDSLAAYLVVKGYDLGLLEVESLVRGLAALAPKSVYSDGRYVALNATPAALYAEIRESLDTYDSEITSGYLSTVPSVGDSS